MVPHPTSFVPRMSLRAAQAPRGGTWLSPSQPCIWWPAAQHWSAAARPSRGPHLPGPAGPPGPPCEVPPGSPRCPEAPGAAQPAPPWPRPAGPAASQPKGGARAVRPAGGRQQGLGARGQALALCFQGLKGEADDLDLPTRGVTSPNAVRPRGGSRGLIPEPCGR